MQNTGGFFICLLKKTAPTPEQVEEEVVKRAGKKHRAPKAESGDAAVKDEEGATGTDAGADVEDGSDENVKDETVDGDVVKDEAVADTVKASEQQKGPRLNRQERRQQKQKGEEYVALERAQWERIQEHFDIVAPFSGAQLFTRSDEVKSVTFVTKSITPELIETMKAKKLKIVYTGLKMFERTESTAGGVIYRLCQAGMTHVLPFMTKRKITVSRRDFQLLLERLGDLLDYDEFEPATQKIFEDAPMGSIVCMMEQPRSLVEYVLACRSVLLLVHRCGWH